MARPPFDPESPGARLLLEMARDAAEWDRSVTVVARTRSYFADDDISLAPGQRAEVPLPWARVLVAHGSASYVR